MCAETNFFEYEAMFVNPYEGEVETRQGVLISEDANFQSVLSLALKLYGGVGYNLIDIKIRKYCDCDGGYIELSDL